MRATALLLAARLSSGSRLRAASYSLTAPACTSPSSASRLWEHLMAALQTAADHMPIQMSIRSPHIGCQCTHCIGMTFGRMQQESVAAWLTQQAADGSALLRSDLCSLLVQRAAAPCCSARVLLAPLPLALLSPAAGRAGHANEHLPRCQSPGEGCKQFIHTGRLPAWGVAARERCER